MNLPSSATRLSNHSSTILELATLGQMAAAALFVCAAAAVSAPAGSENFVTRRKTRMVSVLLVLLAAMLVVVSRNRNAENNAPLNRSENGILAIPASKSVASQSSGATAGVKKLCFERYFSTGRKDVRESWIFVKDFSTGIETKLIKGGEPDISPNGEEIAYTAGEMYDLPGASGQPTSSAARLDPFRIQIIDLRTRKVRDFDSLLGVRHFHPLWSRDGASLAFEVLSDDMKRSDIAVMNVATEKWYRVTANGDIGNGNVSLDGWAVDNQSLILHSLENVYEIGLDGRLLRKIPTIGMNIAGSDSTFLMASDKSFLVFSRTDGTADGPRHVLYIADLKSSKVSQLTTEHTFALSPRWLIPDREILFSCATADTRKNGWDICRIGIDGTGLRKVIDNAETSSYSNQ